VHTKKTISPRSKLLLFPPPLLPSFVEFELCIYVSSAVRKSDLLDAERAVSMLCRCYIVLYRAISCYIAPYRAILYKHGAYAILRSDPQKELCLFYQAIATRSPLSLRDSYLIQSPRITFSATGTSGEPWES